MRAHRVAEIFPLLEGPEFETLKADIAMKGVLEPIVTCQGEILDGRNRYRACQALGIECPAREYTDDDPDPLTFVISLNLHRRHLNESQRAMVAARLATLSRGTPTGSNQYERKSANLPICTLTQSQASEMLNVGDRTVRDAKKVQALGAPELIAAVDNGKIPVSVAVMIANTDAELQRAAIDRIASGVRPLRAVRQVKAEAMVRHAPSLPVPHFDRAPCLYLGGFRRCEFIEPQSIDWVITDPPYAKEYLPLYSDLSRCAERWLKPGGSLLVMSGQSYPTEVFNALSLHLSYQWELTYLTPGGQSAQIWDRRVNTFWKPILWYVKGRYEGPWIGDVCKSAVNDNDKTYHEWGQSESGLYDLMKRFCQPGQRVLDPMMGAGTTGVVALKLGCEFIGIDCAEEHYNTARKRLGRRGSE
jgi:16S rRNA G966 N2-methylase RsmD